MLCKLWVVSALCAVVLSAPTLSIPGANPAEMTVLSEYFQMLASKVQTGRNMAQAPVCNLNNAQLPVASPTPLPGPSAGLVLKHVAIGRGTQNYTCDTTNATAVPVSIGAMATLYNATCIASTYPDLLAALPDVALQFNLTDANQSSLSPSDLAISGHHFFSNLTTPTFNLNSSTGDLGVVPCTKNNTVSAPDGNPKGQDNTGFGSVAWLKLLARDGATGNLEEVYRVNTAGGNPPTVCAGQPATFEIQYASEYWFYAKP